MATKKMTASQVDKAQRALRIIASGRAHVMPCAESICIVRDGGHRYLNAQIARSLRLRGFVEVNVVGDTRIVSVTDAGHALLGAVR